MKYIEKIENKLKKIKSNPKFADNIVFLNETITYLGNEIMVQRRREKMAIEALKLCMMAIKEIHPILNPDEPCIAFEAYESACHAIEKLKGAE